MRWLDGLTDLMNMKFGKLWEMLKDREAWSAAVHRLQRVRLDLVTKQQPTMCKDPLFSPHPCQHLWFLAFLIGVRLGVRLRSFPALTFLGICASHPKHQTSSILWTSPRACWIEGILERTQFNPFTLQIRKQVPR